MAQIISFSTHDFERDNLLKAAKSQGLSINLMEHRLDVDTASLVDGESVVSCFANDCLNAEVLEILSSRGVKMISLRTAGFSHVDIEKARELGMSIARVPSYSPEAIAEHALGLLMCLNRKLINANRRVREFNFTLSGLQGMTMHGKTIGVIGTGQIGAAFVRIMQGMGCKVLCFDIEENEKLSAMRNVSYTDLATIYRESHVISLHCPLNENTHHLINKNTIAKMRDGVILINTGRGALVNSNDLITAIKHKKFGGVALDVYEHEENVFFNDLSASGVDDDLLARLMSFPNVMITSHQAFFTYEALENMAMTSTKNAADFLTNGKITASNKVL